MEPNQGKSQNKASLKKYLSFLHSTEFINGSNFELDVLEKQILFCNLLT